MVAAGTANEVERKFVLDTRAFFSNIDVWPQSPRHVDPRGWLSNFAEGRDLMIAAHLLDSFLLISTAQVQKMVASAFHSLSPIVSDMFSLSPEQYEQDWHEFRASIRLTFPSQRKDPAGSGHLFARHARTLVADQDVQIVDPADLVKELADLDNPCAVVVVDDFSGTGNQFCDLWHRKYSIGAETSRSLFQLHEEGLITQAYFIPAISTARARAHIARLAPKVDVRAAHLIPPRYSATDPETSLVPAELRSHLGDFLERYASAAGYSSSGMYGYERSGLAISFEHSTPDNTLPIFNGGENRPANWRPLRGLG